METPLYPPSVRFEEPRRLPSSLSTGGSAISELLAIPAAWAIVKKDLPFIAGIVNTPQMGPMISTLSLRSLVPFGVVNPEILPAMDAKFKALGEIQ